MLKAAKTAFSMTLPILAPFVCIGIAYGLAMREAGFPPACPILTSLVIAAGSMEFIAASLMLDGASPLYAALLTLMVNGRHLFYGLALLEKYRNTGKKQGYLIFAMMDATFAINSTLDIENGPEREWIMFFVTLFNHIWWVAGTLLGTTCHSIFSIDTKSTGFCLTALFIVIFLEQWRKTDIHDSALLGVGAALFSLAVSGKTAMLPVAIFLTVTILTLFRKPLEKRTGIS